MGVLKRVACCLLRRADNGRNGNDGSNELSTAQILKKFVLARVCRGSKDYQRRAGLSRRHFSVRFRSSAAV